MKENQALTAAKEAKIEELEHKILDATEQTIDLHHDCYRKAEIDLKLKELDHWIQLPQYGKDSNQLSKNDLNDKLVLKNKSRITLKSSGSICTPNVKFILVGSSLNFRYVKVCIT